jgi:hypothetical protein
MRFSLFMAALVTFFLCLKSVADAVTCKPYTGSNYSNPFPLSKTGVSSVIPEWSEVGKPGQPTSGYKAYVKFDWSFNAGTKVETRTTTLSNKGGPGGKTLMFDILGGRNGAESFKFWLASADSCTMDTPTFPLASSYDTPVYLSAATAIKIYVGPS